MATLLSPSSVNTMSSDNDKCFQCRKLATWHTIVPTLDALIATIMDTLQQIALTKYHLQAHWHNTEITPLVYMTDQHLRIIATPGVPTMTIGTGTDSVDLDLSHTTPDIGVTVVVIPAEAILDHFIDLHVIAPCITGAPAHTATAMTHHIVDPHHADISPEMTVDPEHTDPIGNIINPHKDHLPVHNQHPGSPRIEGTNRLQLMIHPQNIIAQMNRTVIQWMI